MKTGVKLRETGVKLSKTEQNRGGLGIGGFEAKSQGEVLEGCGIGLVWVGGGVLVDWR